MTETVSTLLTLQLLYVFNVSCCKHFDWFHIDTVLSHTKMCISGNHELVQHKFWMQVFELCCFSCACALPSSDSAVRTDLNTCPCTSVQTLQNRNNIDGVFRILSVCPGDICTTLLQMWFCLKHLSCHRKQSLLVSAQVPVLLQHIRDIKHSSEVLFLR